MRSEKLLQFLMAGALAVLGGVLWDAMRDHVVQTGTAAPSFSVTADSGKSISPTNFGGKILVLNFWATWCPPCIKETPLLEAFHRRVKDRGVVLFGVSVDKNKEKYQKFIKRFGVSYATMNDPEQKINDMFGTYRYPETYVIDSKGTVILKKVGELDQETLEQIEKLAS
ncbi:MAG: TlpA disulfide reductase family protein [Bryobacteraceae bacterium]